MPRTVKPASVSSRARIAPAAPTPTTTTSACLFAMSGSPFPFVFSFLTALSGRFFRLSRPGRHSGGLLLGDGWPRTGPVIEEVRLLAGEPLNVPQGHDGLVGKVGTVVHLLSTIAVLCAGEPEEAPTHGVAVAAVGRVAEHPFYGVTPYHGEEVLGALAETGDLTPLERADDSVLVLLRKLEELLTVPLLGVSVERAHPLPVGPLPPEVGSGQGSVYVVHDPRLSGARVFFVAGYDPGRQSLDRVRLVQEKEHEPRRIDFPVRVHNAPPFRYRFYASRLVPDAPHLREPFINAPARSKCACTIKNRRRRSLEA